MMIDACVPWYTHDDVCFLRVCVSRVSRSFFLSHHSTNEQNEQGFLFNKNTLCFVKIGYIAH